jgi:hypothetical protein
MVSNTINTVSQLQIALVKAEEILSDLRKDAPYEEFEHR